MWITGKTKLLGVMGWPVEHSRSPQMQAAAAESAGLNVAYVPLAVAPEKVGDAVRGLPALGFLGANVTVPHKQAVMEFLDELSPAASGIGAVNTIIVDPDSGQLRGDNTDADGAWEALREEIGVEAKDEGVAVIGAGGAARAVAWGAGARGARKVVILNRTVAKAEALAGEMARQHAGTEYIGAGLDDREALAGVRIFMQMTSLGMKEGDPLPLDPEAMPADAVGLEAVYAPLDTHWRMA